MKKSPYPDRTLARAYIPDQVYSDPWGPMEGLKKGTIFEELYRPYVKGTQKSKPGSKQKAGYQAPSQSTFGAAQRKGLLEIQAIEFTLVELNLYLDTHPNDRQALNDYNNAVRQLYTLKRNYEARYGPLANFGSAPSKYPWQWIEEPWPWESSY